MPIEIYDSLQRAKVPLTTREPGKATIYSCGATVYNFIHIGNARTSVWFDQIRRYLRYRGFDVTYVTNYTDVDDKIIDRANLEGLAPEGITAKYIKAFEDDLEALGAEYPDLICRATQEIDGMVAAISGLIENDKAYEADGNVWFSVESFDGYGKLSHRTLEDMRAGERVEPHAGKRHPLDFSLWKAAKEGEPSWDSPWGPGRPGWHIECSVMATKYLQMGFDIHGGGSDLIFPHHENEIAQAEGLHEGQDFARHWMHAGMVQMDTEKMSKSLGNVALAKEVVARFGGEQARYWCLMGSYRSQANFSEDSLRDASQGYERWRTFSDSARHVLGDAMPEAADVRRPVDDEGDATGYVRRFIAAMDDDFNSAAAFAVVHDLVREGNRLLEGAQKGDTESREGLLAIVESFLEITSVLGFRFPSQAGDNSELTAGLLDYLLELREDARKERAFERADAIRDRIAELGVQVEDTASGPRWRIDAGSS